MLGALCRAFAGSARLCFAISLSLLAAACGSTSADPDGGPVSSDGGALQAQLAHGAETFDARCAHCHAADGAGSAAAPRLIGLSEGALPLEPRAGSGRTGQFVTAADVVAFASVNMPADAPGTLAEDDYYAVTAWILSENGVALDEPLTAANASAVTIPR